jgi:hypothetical protein
VEKSKLTYVFEDVEYNFGVREQMLGFDHCEQMEDKSHECKDSQQESKLQND